MTALATRLTIMGLAVFAAILLAVHLAAAATPRLTPGCISCAADTNRQSLSNDIDERQMAPKAPDLATQHCKDHCKSAAMVRPAKLTAILISYARKVQPLPQGIAPPGFSRPPW